MHNRVVVLVESSLGKILSAVTLTVNHVSACQDLREIVDDAKRLQIHSSTILHELSENPDNCKVAERRPNQGSWRAGPVELRIEPQAIDWSLTPEEVVLECCGKVAHDYTCKG